VVVACRFVKDGCAAEIGCLCGALPALIGVKKTYMKTKQTKRRSDLPS
jgi:hypothetical protein